MDATRDRTSVERRLRGREIVTDMLELLRQGEPAEVVADKVRARVELLSLRDREVYQAVVINTLVVSLTEDATAPTYDWDDPGWRGRRRAAHEVARVLFNM
jgi:hypothetical protein